jgi:hypothetical protein
LVEGLLTSWGFDNLDLDWEASVTSSLGIAYVLRLRDGFDVAPLLGKLDERGFGTEVTNGVTVRSHVMSNDDWVLTDLAFLNVALMPDGRTLVMSSQPDALKQSLAERGRLAGPEGPPVIRDAVAALDHPSGAWLDFSLDRLCDPISHARSDATRTAAEELLGEVGPLHPYTLVALGYRPDLEPTGRIVFGYVDPADAGADLEGRRRLAAEGLSVETGAPIENRLFSLVDANVEGGSLVLRVGPPIIDDPTPRAGAISLPRFLLGMAFRYDMLFAACDISL